MVPAESDQYNQDLLAHTSRDSRQFQWRRNYLRPKYGRTIPERYDSEEPFQPAIVHLAPRDSRSVDVGLSEQLQFRIGGVTPEAESVGLQHRSQHHGYPVHSLE